jgi:hypothetical protein
MHSGIIPNVIKLPHKYNKISVNISKKSAHFSLKKNALFF